jgi:integrase
VGTRLVSPASASNAREGTRVHFVLITKPVGPHTLRHAFITAALDAGVPLRDVQEAASTLAHIVPIGRRQPAAIRQLAVSLLGQRGRPAACLIRPARATAK